MKDGGGNKTKKAGLDQSKWCMLKSGWRHSTNQSVIGPV